MKKDCFYREVLPIFEDVFQKFLREIFPLSYKIYTIKEYQRVIVVEDELVIYFALYENYPDQLDSPKKHNYEFFNGNITFLYSIRIEEFTANEIFKFNFSKFCKQFEPQINTYYFIKYTRFSSIASLSPIPETVNIFNYINKELKKLRLKERQESWEGWLYNFILFEITNFNNETTVCVWNSCLSDINKTAYQRCKDLQSFCFSGYGINAYNKNKIEKNFTVENNFFLIAKSIKTYAEKKKSTLNLYNHIKYTFFRKPIKNIADIDNISLLLISEYRSHKFDNFPFFTYTQIPSKWKSEYLVKELCEKLYGINDVIYQYRPFYLATSKGQLSYDIYLSKEKIAIEYQGKQHFQPINYFGGEESFLKQKQRDELKRKLSEINHIQLIYINYTDPLTEEFISQKVNEAKKYARRIY